MSVIDDSGDKKQRRKRNDFKLRTRRERKIFRRKAGDQTGTEWQVINWYNRPWKCVLRHPDAATRKLIAQMAKAAAVNNMVGYCQSHRGTFWTNLADSNFDPAQITVPCEADCSSGVAAIVKGAGYRLKMRN